MSLVRGCLVMGIMGGWMVEISRSLCGFLCILSSFNVAFISCKRRGQAIYININYSFRNWFWCWWKSFATWTKDWGIVTFWLLLYWFQCNNFVCSRSWLVNFFDELNILSIIFRNDPSFFINFRFDSISSRPNMKKFSLFKPLFFAS